MAMKSYDDAQPVEWVTIGGVTKAGKKNPNEIKGRYLGRTVGPSSFDPGKSKVVFNLSTPEGIVGVNGNTNLVTQMDKAERNFASKEGLPPIGAAIHIKCTGFSKTKKGNDMKVFSVSFDAEDIVDVTELGAASASDYGSDYESEETEEGGDDDDEAAYAPAPNLGKVAAGATLSPADRQAAVAALLSKKSK